MAGIIARAGASEAGTLSGSPPIDPYEIAYLRGGAREVLTLRLFELLQMGYFVVVEKRRWFGTDCWLTLAHDAPGRQHLANPDKVLLTFFEKPRTVRQILKLKFPPELVSACREFRHDLRQRGLLRGWLAPEGKTFGTVAAVLVIVLLFFVVGMAAQAPVLSALAVPAFVLGLISVLGVLNYRPTAAGLSYLQNLRSQYAGYAKYDSATWALAPPATLLAAIAVFGFDILRGSPADAFATLLESRAQGNVQYGVESGGGCDSGCGGCGGCGG